MQKTISGDTLYDSLRIIHKNAYMDDDRKRNEATKLFLYLRSQHMAGVNLKNIQFGIKSFGGQI